jgi:hypothetical protein
MDFAPDATPRYVLAYIAAGVTHHTMVRGSRSNNLSDLNSLGQGFFHAVFTALAPLMPADLAFLDAVLIDKDTDIGVPGTVPTHVAGTTAVNTYSPMDKITHTTFAGKGSGGSKVNLKLYGINYGLDSTTSAVRDFVLTPGDETNIDNAITALNAQGNARAIDNTGITWHNRATVKVNDKWLRLVRKGVIS